MTSRKKRKLSLAEMCRRYKRLYSGPIYDSLEKMGLPNQVLSHEIKPLLPTMKMAGPAYTVKGSRRHQDHSNVERVSLLEGLKRHYVAIYDAGGEDKSGHWGELTSNRAAVAGCQGIIVDGGARDTTWQLKIPGWNCFCRYTSPIEAARRSRIVGINVPILMSGSLTTLVEVSPDDFIFADMDGVTVIPQEIAPEVLAQAEDVALRERKGRALLWKGKSMEDIAKRYGVG